MANYMYIFVSNLIKQLCIWSLNIDVSNMITPHAAKQYTGCFMWKIIFKYHVITISIQLLHHIRKQVFHLISTYILLETCLKVLINIHRIVNGVSNLIVIGAVRATRVFSFKVDCSFFYFFFWACVKLYSEESLSVPKSSYVSIECSSYHLAQAI